MKSGGWGGAKNNLRPEGARVGRGNGDASLFIPSPLLSPFAQLSNEAWFSNL